MLDCASKLRTILGALFALGGACYADYTGTLPSNITVSGSSTQNAVMNCASYWECVFGDYSHNSTISSNGTSSTLTLKATLPPNPHSQRKSKPFFIGNLDINHNANLSLSDFDSFNLGSALNIAQNASLTFSNNAGSFATLSNTKINVAGNLNISASGFSNRGSVQIATGGSASITSGNIKNEGPITNYGNLTISSHLYSIGQTYSTSSIVSGVANIINYGGTISITGNLINGGQNTQTTYQNCRIGGCGGGNLVTYGGSISISGQLISEPKDNQSSTIAIYGGTITASAGVQNKAGSTLTFGAHNGVMGKITGNLTNAGNVVVDLAGAGAGSYEIVSGNASGLDSITIKNGNNAFASASFSGKSINFTLNDKAIASFKSNVNANELLTLNALGDGIYTLGGADSAKLKNMANGINAGAFSLGLSLPFIIATNLDLAQQQRLGASLSLIALGAFGGTSGFMGGLKGGIASKVGGISIGAQVAYASGSFTHTSNTDLAKQDSTLSAKSVGASVGALLPLRYASLDINAQAISVSGQGNRVLDISHLRTTHILKSSPKLALLGLDSILHFKSNALDYFFGVKQNIVMAQKFSETGTQIALQSNAFNAYLLKATAGGEMGGFKAIGWDLSVALRYEILALSSQKRTFAYALTQGTLTSPLPYTSLLHLGAKVKREFGNSLLDIQGFVRGIFGDISNFYSLGVSGSWHF